MNIRKVTTKDFKPLYQLGLETPEFRVSSSGEFMDRDEFLSAIENPKGVFLLAENNGVIAGFIYAKRKDNPELQKKWACLVYLTIKPEYRRQGIAQRLYDACIEELRQFGINCLYGWANSESDGSIIGFMKKNGFSEGHKYTWMDKEI
jgi:ribosomal protein S18 acetylase RimI-like enzyme